MANYKQGGKRHPPLLQPALRKVLTKVVNEYRHCVFEFIDGKVFMLWKYHTYLNCRRDAKRVYIGKGSYPDRYLYLYVGHDLLLKTITFTKPNKQGIWKVH